MVRLHVVLMISVFIALVFTVIADKNHRPDGRKAGHSNSEQGHGHKHGHRTTTVPLNDRAGGDPDDTTSPEGNTDDTTSPDSPGTSSEPVTPQRKDWCRFNNGSFVPLGYTFIHKGCSLCQCTKSRLIRCQTLQCMPTYCVDNEMPFRREGQCCTQCPYEKPHSACVFNNISFPHGTIMKSVQNQMQCWCQLGHIECRDYMGSFLQGSDFWSDGTALYIIIIVIAIVLIFGVLLCCGCTIGFFYYYNQNQHVFQQAYDQYVNNSGWQPMNEGEGNEVDMSAEEKRMEAEKDVPNLMSDTVPPPYSIPTNGAFMSGHQEK